MLLDAKKRVLEMIKNGIVHHIYGMIHASTNLPDSYILKI
ncbi:hypothetical protein FDUTEX481_02410 [Tolypothrix sp. PCC 7601]|nr:hypothetical protein FDUTEX481_02410 [Tolypothrix sp. PCC 7601]